jgi:hypothetical protein
MAKKLLSEAVVRRFAKLANLPAVNESMYAEEEEDMADAEMAPEAEMPAEEPAEEMPDEEPMDDMGAEDLELTDDEAMAIIELGKKLEAAMPEGAEEELPAEEPMDDMGAEEMPAEMPMDDMAGEEEEIMEALEGINYVPEKKEIVEEVARRVAKRLLKAKRAERKLQEALGNKTPSNRKPAKK